MSIFWKLLFRTGPAALIFLVSAIGDDPNPVGSRAYVEGDESYLAQFRTSVSGLATPNDSRSASSTRSEVMS